MSYSYGNNSNDTITNIMSTPVRGHGGSGLASPNEFMNHNTSSTNRTSHHNNPNYNYYQGVLQLDSNYNSDTNGQEQAPTTTTTSQQQQQQQQAYMDALEDVHTRFILNLPDSELQTADRIFFQLEQAWWFYEDWICDPQQQQQGEESTTPAAAPSISSLPRFSTLKPFSAQMFAFSPLLPPLEKFADMWHEFSCYKRKISNYGCILLNADYTHVILCRLWDSKTWTFPSGKINQGEDGRQAAARETYEETGFDPHCQFGLTATWKEQEEEEEDDNDTTKITWKYPLREQDALSFQEDNGSGKRRTCYICHGVPKEFPFLPIARKEVSAVEWHPISDLPKKSYAVLPFIGLLRRWIYKQQQKKQYYQQQQEQQHQQQQYQKNRTTSTNKGKRTHTPLATGPGGSGKKTPVRDRSHAKNRRSTPTNKRSSSRGKFNAGGDKDEDRWSEEEMFKVNERLLGRKIEYDGNPHLFAEQGFMGGPDPHSFRVVGGGFLNSVVGGGADTDTGAVLTGFQLAPPPHKSKLQPLFRKCAGGGGDSTTLSDGDAAAGDNFLTDSEPDNDGDGMICGFQPFFSDEGATPWGEVVDAVREGTGVLLPPATGSRPESRAASRSGSRARDGASAVPLSSGQDDPSAQLLRLLHRDVPTTSETNNTNDPPPVEGGTSNKKKEKQQQQQQNKKPTILTQAALGDAADSIVFLTDAEITAKSQAEKLKQFREEQEQTDGGQVTATTTSATSTNNKDESYADWCDRLRRQYEEDMAYVRQWVANLPKAPPTKRFGTFKLDADAIMAAAAASVPVSL